MKGACPSPAQEITLVRHAVWYTIAQGWARYLRPILCATDYIRVGRLDPRRKYCPILMVSATSQGPDAKWFAVAENDLLRFVVSMPVRLGPGPCACAERRFVLTCFNVLRFQFCSRSRFSVP